VGHFGQGIEHYLSDFSAFHGAIFFTKLSLHNIESLYRSRVFTSDTIAPAGVITIKDNDFEPLIQSALDARGFTRTEERESIKLGIDEKIFIQKINEVADRVDKNEIKHVFVIGVPNRTESQMDYMEEFLNLLGNDCFALSFTHTNNMDNVLFANVDYATPFVYLALSIFTNRKSFEKMKSIVLYTRCEPHTFPTVFNMKYMGINEIYFTDCSPNVINPALTDTIRKMIDLKRYTNPKDDFKAMIVKQI
jgi:hydroxylamine reductase (hybrid-cluster protein)